MILHEVTVCCLVLLLADRPTGAAGAAQTSIVSELYEAEDPRPGKKRKPPVEDVLDYDRPSEVDYEEELELNRREDLEPKRRRTAADAVAIQGQLAYF